MSNSDFMRRALELALRGAGRVSPNPMVGAVLVHGGRIIGEGFHERCGEQHAEVNCLASVQEEDRPFIRESTMYVTLEPCTHTGRQPSCAARLITEHIKEVVIAVEDPFPAVSGKGVAMLRGAGVEVETGVCEQAARWMCRRFLSVQEAGRPYIILKWAESRDQFIAPGDGSRHQLSNMYSQTMVHKWRTEESAIMVGYNTALGDNPRLSARLWEGPQPLRIALDRDLRLPGLHHLMDDTVATWIVNAKRSAPGKTRLVQLDWGESLLPELLQELRAAGKNSLIVEGGRTLLQSFIGAGYWDEARVFKTTKMVGRGILAPRLGRTVLAADVAVGDDRMHLYQPPDSSYSYLAGAAF